MTVRGAIRMYFKTTTLIASSFLCLVLVNTPTYARSVLDEVIKEQRGESDNSSTFGFGSANSGRSLKEEAILDAELKHKQDSAYDRILTERSTGLQDKRHLNETRIQLSFLEKELKDPEITPERKKKVLHWIQQYKKKELSQDTALQNKLNNAKKAMEKRQTQRDLDLKKRIKEIESIKDKDFDYTSDIRLGVGSTSSFGLGNTNKSISTKPKETKQINLFGSDAGNKTLSPEEQKEMKKQKDALSEAYKRNASKIKALNETQRKVAKQLNREANETIKDVVQGKANQNRKIQQQELPTFSENDLYEYLNENIEPGGEEEEEEQVQVNTNYRSLTEAQDALPDGFVLPNRPLNLDDVTKLKIKAMVEAYLKAMGSGGQHLKAYERDELNILLFNYGVQVLDTGEVICLENVYSDDSTSSGMLAPDVKLPNGAVNLKLGEQ